ncbi:MAG: hypothetical protein IAE80_20355 [Anaerolinea sp.]|nr:hypothetical protein [Anaerolinea sp.]
MRQLTISRVDFEDAFEIGNFETDAYLDCTSGAVIFITADDRAAYDFASETDDADTSEAVNTHLIDQIEAEFGTRYLAIPKQDSREGYRDMEQFIAALEDEKLQSLLETAIRGKGAFRRFKDVLHLYPEAQQAWFKFRDEHLAERMAAWFEEHEIDVTFV